MTATETRALAEAKTTHQIKEILASIKKSAIKGEFQMWYYESLEDSTRKKLIELGYEVGTTTYDRNEYITQISW